MGATEQLEGMPSSYAFQESPGTSCTCSKIDGIATVPPHDVLVHVAAGVTPRVMHVSPFGVESLSVPESQLAPAVAGT